MALFSDWDHPPPTHPTHRLRNRQLRGCATDQPTHSLLSFFYKCCAVSPPQQSMCGVPPSQYMLSFNVVRCPHSICSTHQQGMCGVPPSSSTNISGRCPLPPQCNSVPLPHLALSWILIKVENLSSSSLQDEATYCFF